MERIEKYGIFCRSFEGGWSNHPNDSGGATMKGVTYATFCKYRASKGLPKPTLNDLRNITAKEWNAVLRWHTWDRIKCDEYKSQWVAYLLADCVWMSGEAQQFGPESAVRCPVEPAQEFPSGHCHRQELRFLERVVA